MSNDVFTLSKPGTDLTAELPVRKGTAGPDVIDISRLYRDVGVFTYDPGFMATGSCESDITFIDGQKGVLMYRGYPVEQLAAHSNFMEVAYLTNLASTDWTWSVKFGDLDNDGLIDVFFTNERSSSKIARGDT